MPYINGVFQPLTDEQIIPVARIKQECGQEPPVLVKLHYHFNFLNIFLLAAVVVLCIVVFKKYQAQTVKLFRHWWLIILLAVALLVLTLSVFGNFQRLVSEYKLNKKFIYRVSESVLSEAGQKYQGCWNKVINEFDLDNGSESTTTKN